MPPQPRGGAIKLPDIEKATFQEEETGLKDHPHPRSKSTLKLLLLVPVFLYLISTFEFPFPKPTPSGPVPAFIEEGIKQCAIISRPPPHPTPYNSKRKYSDRYVKGTPSYHIVNATLWTGEKDGSEILEGTDLWLQGGVIRGIGKSDAIKAMISKDKGDGDAVEVDVKGAWVTPGIVDLHSHLALDSAPELRGSDDTNSLKSAVLPWLRSLDGFNTHDLAFNLSISGGITTFLALPGSAGNIGGQAFVFKPRQTYENTPQSMQVESPFVISSNKNGSVAEWERTHSWRHVKHACGENPARVYGNTRMDSAYDFRRAYTEGKKLKDEQDRWCASPKTQTSPFPSSLEWEVLSDVIRGHVKVNIHCYETTDLNTLVRISNEFQFPIAAFHHAHETYLVPDLLKQSWGSTPAVAIFATNARYKREAYRGSEFAPAILAEAGIDVIMKSDHPVLDSRYLVFEAAQAHHYGLNWTLAMSSVTTKSAKAMGMDHRLGYLREGYDADVVIWDSFPLNLGATPRQTFIDGIAQLEDPHSVYKGKEMQKIPKSGNYTEQAKEALTTRGDPDLRPKTVKRNVIFNGVKSLYHEGAIAMAKSNGFVGDFENLGTEGVRVVVRDGVISCIGDCVVEEELEFDVIDLKGGAIAPGMITVGSYLGLMEIRQEKSTWDGPAYDPLSGAPDIIDGLLVRASDGISFGSKDELLAYRSGVTSAVVYPISSSLIAGLSVQFSTSSPHPLAPHSILTSTGALHIAIEASSKLSTSTKIGILRRLLEGGYKESSEVTEGFKAVAKGKLRLVVEVGKADIMAALVRLKEEVAPGMKMTFLGGQESWMIADSLAAASIGVIVSPPRSFPGTWSTHRILPGPPLSETTLPTYLHSRGVKVGLGINEEWQARNTRLEVGWEYVNSGGEGGALGKKGSLDLVSKNLEELLGLDSASGEGWVAWQGDLFGFEGVVRGVQSDGGVNLF